MPHDFVDSIFRFLSDMDYQQLAALGGATAATYAVYRRYTRISLDDVPGPENPSFLHGTLPFRLSEVTIRLNMHVGNVGYCRTPAVFAGC